MNDLEVCNPIYNNLTQAKRWLLPEYQGYGAVAVTPQLVGLLEAEPAVAARRKQP